MEEGRDRALEVRRAVLGAEYVDRALAGASEFARPFQEFVTHYVWGEGWLDETLDRKTRSLLTLALVTTLGQRDEIRLHVGGALRNGCSPAELMALFKHVALYAGVGMAVAAVNIANEELGSGEYASDGQTTEAEQS
ncbi:MAG: carboxymuconolactone decarboxylase family protein [Nocardioidaceae bacterium]